MWPWRRIRVALTGIEARQGCGNSVDLRSLSWEWARATWVRGMGGGPRTYPGGVSKWKWKRMMVKKREERQQRWLAREKSVYEMRQRAEVLAAHPELEQPWEKLTLFPPPGISTGQQIASLVRRFDKPSVAEDLWTQRDGPQLPTGLDAEAGDAALPSKQAEQPCGDPNRLYLDSFYGEISHSPSRQQPYSSRWLRMGMETPKKKKEPSPIGKSMQDYLDAFDTDPLGVAVGIDTCTTKDEEHKDHTDTSEDMRETAKKKGSSKKKVGKGGRKNRGR